MPIRRKKQIDVKFSPKAKSSIKEAKTAKGPGGWL